MLATGLLTSTIALTVLRETMLALRGDLRRLRDEG